MRYSIEPREGRYVKAYGFVSFARNFSDKYRKSLKYLMDKGIEVKNLPKLLVKKYLKKQQKQLEFNW